MYCSLENSCNTFDKKTFRKQFKLLLPWELDFLFEESNGNHRASFKSAETPRAD